MNKQLDLPDIPSGSNRGKRKTQRRLRYPIWTENKAKLIERYLYYFIMITKHGTYIDGFAGPQEADKPEMWAANLVLQTEPRWLRNIHLCDSGAEPYRRLQELKETHVDSGREIKIYHQDFNTLVSGLFSRGKIKEKEATFVLLDQRTFECHWSTVEAVARGKAKGMKAEIFYFFPEGWINRAASQLKDERIASLWWGNDTWPELMKISGQDRGQLVSDRIKTELGYEFVAPWPIRERKGGGRIMYYMIHATDHPEAPVLMNRAYHRAVDDFEPLDQLQIDFDAGNFAP